MEEKGKERERSKGGRRCMQNVICLYRGTESQREQKEKHCRKGAGIGTVLNVGVKRCTYCERMKRGEVWAEPLAPCSATMGVLIFHHCIVLSILYRL